MTPILTHVADFRIQVGPPITIGETAEGLRRVVPILGGTITGPKLSGKILAAGADYQVIRADGFSKLDARYVAELDGGDMLYIVNTGVRFGPPELMARITAGEPVDPAEIYFRTIPRFEIFGPAHAWLLKPLFLATGARHKDRVELRVFEIG